MAAQKSEWMAVGRRPCPKCHITCIKSHISKCKGDSIKCEICGLAVVDTYMSVYNHYRNKHGRLGEVRGYLKSQATGKPRGRPRAKAHVNDIIDLKIIVPYSYGKVVCYYSKSKQEWDALVKQGLHVYDTKNEDQFALMCAVASYSVEYCDNRITNKA